MSKVNRRIRRPCAVLCVAACLLVSFCTRARAGEPPARLLLAQGSGRLTNGSDELLWVAVVKAGAEASADQTTLYLRNIYRSEPWRSLPVIPGRVQALANLNDQAIVILSGSAMWGRYLSGGTFNYGAKLPAGGRMVGLAGSHPMTGGGAATLWAMGAVAGGMPAAQAATRPATRPATAATLATAPTSQPVKLVLFALRQDKWSPMAELPGDRADGARLSLAVAGELPCVAMLEVDGKIAVYAFSPADGTWQLASSIVPGFVVSDFRMLAQDDGTPAVWAAPEQGAGTVWLGPAYAPVALRLEGVTPEASQRDLAAAGMQFHLFYRQNGRVMQQQFDHKGIPQKEPMELAEPARSDLPVGWQTVALLMLLAFLLMGSFRYQRGMRLVQVAGGWVIAAPLSRLAAAAVDGAPVIAAWVFLAVRAWGLKESTLARFAFDPWVIAGGILYVSHTLVIESLFGRSLGKMLLGLHVVQLNGQRPGIGALAARNLLRALDVPVPPVWFVGLLFDMAVMTYSPLRQRIGDFAAKTLVVRKMRPGEEQEAVVVEPEAEQDEEEGE